MPVTVVFGTLAKHEVNQIDIEMGISRQSGAAARTSHLKLQFSFLERSPSRDPKSRTWAALLSNDRL